MTDDHTESAPPTPDPKKEVALVGIALRAAAILSGGGLLLRLTRELLRGEIHMSQGDVGDEPIVLTTGPELLVGYLMWAPFLAAILLLGVKPGLFITYKKLGPILLAITFINYVLLSIIT